MLRFLTHLKKMSSRSSADTRTSFAFDGLENPLSRIFFPFHRTTTSFADALDYQDCCYPGFRLSPIYAHTIRKDNGPWNVPNDITHSMKFVPRTRVCSMPKCIHDQKRHTFKTTIVSLISSSPGQSPYFRIRSMWVMIGGSSCSEVVYCLQSERVGDTA